MAEITAPPDPPTKRRSPKFYRAEAAYRASLAELGATLLEPEYLGSNKPHRTRCRNGHECTTWPNDIARGRGFCRACAGQDPRTAEAAFRARVEELGGTVLEPTWLGNKTPHRIRCGLGHESTPLPSGVKRGGGICRTCVGLEPLVAEAAFRERVEERGGVVLGAWVNNATAVCIACAEGHEFDIFPGNAGRYGGLCRTCSGRDPKAVEALFRARVAELGGVVLEPAWKGALAPHKVRCAAGHVTYPWPSSIKQGGGICRFCRGKVWDVFYVVQDDETVKLGITSGDPRPRLADHARDGLSRVVRLHTGLTGTVAPDLERQVLEALGGAGEKSVRGKEYFPARVLPLVLSLVDEQLTR
ncbi:hypothetical protein ACWFR1_12180 [Streptomyces sp. NPDC055103]